MNNEFISRVVSVEIRNKAIFNGILTGVGSKWILIKYIPVDFVIDGLALINTKYISNVGASDSDLFKEQILKLKNIDFDANDRFNLDSTEQLLSELQELGDLVRIELKDHNKSYVGKITATREKSMKVQLIDTKCNPLGEEIFLYNELRALYLSDDYLQSLDLYNNSKASQ